MKKRTIGEIVHLPFAWFLEDAIKDGHKITDIEEYAEKFKFKMDGYSMEFSKSGAYYKAQLKTCYRMLLGCEFVKHVMENINESKEEEKAFEKSDCAVRRIL